MAMTRINARVSGPLAEFVEQMVGDDGMYETPSEYVRDLIRRDMDAQVKAQEAKEFGEAILEGYRDVAAGLVITSTGNLEDDLALFAELEATIQK